MIGLFHLYFIFCVGCNEKQKYLFSSNYVKNKLPPRIKLLITSLNPLLKHIEIKTILNISTDDYQMKTLDIYSWSNPIVVKNLTKPIPEEGLSFYPIFPPSKLTNGQYIELKKFIRIVDSKMEFEVYGNPYLYPFDTYDAVIGINSMQYKMVGKKHILERYFVCEIFAPGDLYIINPQKGLPQKYDKYGFTKNEINNIKQLSPDIFSFSLKRSYFLQSMTIFLLVIMLLYILSVIMREAKEIYKDGIAIFLALWAIRNILTIQAPIFPCLIDIVILELYILSIVIVVVKTFIFKLGDSGHHT